MKKIFRRAVCSILCLFVAVSSVIPAVAAGYTTDYPQGVTAGEALNAVKGTDKLLNYVVPTLTGATLSQTVKPMIYNDEVVSEFVVSLYKELSANSKEIESIGIDISVSAVAEGLGDYPNVQKALSGSSSWDDVNLSGVKWGIKNKNDFAVALGKAMSPFNDIFYTLLCSGTYKISRLIKIEGANGYENAVVPTLKALKCTGLMTQAEFTAQADKDKSNMIKNIILPVLSMLERVLKAPMNNLTEVLPSFAYFVQSGEMDACMDSLLSPVFSNPLVEVAVFLKILDLDSMKIDMNEMLTTGLSDMASEKGLTLAPVNFERLSKCGSKNGSEFEADKGRAYVEIMRWLIDTVKLNEKKLPEFMEQMGGNSKDIPTDMLGGMLKNDTDALVGTVILLFTPSKLDAPQVFSYPDVAKTVVQYTPNLTEDNYKKVLNEIDDLLDDFVKEGGSYGDIESLLSSRIYTNGNINALLTGIYGTLEKEGLTDLLVLLGIDATPKGVAKYIKKDYPAVYEVLNKANSWSKLSLKNVSWGFYNGSRRGFQNALVATLRPLYPLLKVLLAGEDMVVMDSITVKGADGYNTAVIPLLEALGCKESSVKTYSQYLKDRDKDAVIVNIAEPVFDLLDEVFDNPVKTLTRILPNIVYFMNSGSLEKCISNLLIPVTSLTSKMSSVTDLNFDVSELTGKLDIDKMLRDMLDGSGMKIAEFDIDSVAGMGTKTEKTSKSTLNGNYVKYSYIEADQTDVLMSLLRVLAKTMKLPGNENLLVGSMGSGNDAFSTYSSSIGEQFAEMTEDELIEWLYNLLFKERAQIEIVVDDDYVPTIIYKEAPKSHTALYILGGYTLVAAVIGAIIFFNRKRLYC